MTVDDGSLMTVDDSSRFAATRVRSVFVISVEALRRDLRSHHFEQTARACLGLSSLPVTDRFVGMAHRDYRWLKTVGRDHKGVQDVRFDHHFSLRLLGVRHYHFWREISWLAWGQEPDHGSRYLGIFAHV